MSDALGFELPSALMEPTTAANPLPFDAEGPSEPVAVAETVPASDETVH
jgi:hypothetical protein